MQEIESLASTSRRYGTDLRFVFLGGGNTSFKTADRLYIKPSGVALADIQAEQFIALDRAALRRVLTENLPNEKWEREAAVKDLMAASVRPCGGGRPSVEAPLHNVIQYRYVVHLHPALVNGMTCARDGASVCRQLFPDALWVEYVDPGYTLARVVRDRLEDCVRGTGRQPAVVFLQNHGVFVSADSCQEIDQTYARIMATLTSSYAKAGVATELTVSALDAATVRQLCPPLRTWLGNREQRAILSSSPWFVPAPAALSPDHVVYARSYPLCGDLTADTVATFVRTRGYRPKVVASPGQFVAGADTSLKGARETLVAARDAALVCQLTAAFGGPRYLADPEREFIEQWEVEAYRRKIGEASAGTQRLGNRVCVVTGAAQGFGLGIAAGLAAAGGIVVLADLNLQGARQASEDLNRRCGKDRTLALSVNVADEDSVAGLIADTVRECGGLDLFVANAGVLRAGPVKTFTRKDWDFVTNVNYTGYFLCVKHAAAVMAAQKTTADSFWTDIVQINSKSGLEGSNRNAAYAGTKFGTLGLTQSFAKELIEDRIKVNSICPGNYFDGPLWSDPQNGLFVQYLRAGKVPGAKTIEDVRRSYEEKVPMARGCTPEDVVRAILYTVEQQYETGQAIPVTGGQIMLK